MYCWYRSKRRCWKEMCVRWPVRLELGAMMDFSFPSEQDATRFLIISAIILLMYVFSWNYKKVIHNFVAMPICILVLPQNSWLWRWSGQGVFQGWGWVWLRLAQEIHRWHSHHQATVWEVTIWLWRPKFHCFQQMLGQACASERECDGWVFCALVPGLCDLPAPSGDLEGLKCWSPSNSCQGHWCWSLITVVVLIMQWSRDWHWWHKSWCWDKVVLILMMMLVKTLKKIF